MAGDTRAAHAPLVHLVPGWFSMVMGLAGLALAWHRATPLMGEMAEAAALGLGLLALSLFVLLGGASLLRLQRHPEAWADDLRHPVRHAMVATLPTSALLLATLGSFLLGPRPWLSLLWQLAALAQLGVTLWVLRRWWRPKEAGGLAWPVLTPALILPVVGNVLAPLAGVQLGHADWAAAQFGIGALFWPMLLALLLVRLALQGLWPERLLPSVFILIAPPAVIGLAALQLGAPQVLAWLCWGIAMMTLAWVAGLLPRIAKTPLGLAHWGMSFPMAALSALTLRLAEGGALQALAMILLAASSLLVCALLLATWRGLRNGSLLAPEPVAMLQTATPN